MSNKFTSIKIISTNVGRSSAAHEIALELAFKSQIDVLLVQEPYIYRDLARRITRKHPFDYFTPVDDLTRRPRVLTYTRENSNFSVTQDRPLGNLEQGEEDVLLLTIKCRGISPIQVINIYNAPPGGTNPGAGLSFLFSLPDSHFPSKTLLAGDFNLHHHNWHPSYQGSSSRQAEDLVRWLESRNLTFVSDIDIPTHCRGNVLDLAFASNPLLALGTSSSVQQDLDVTSDHFPVSINVPCRRQDPVPSNRLRFATIDQHSFFSLLSLTYRYVFSIFLIASLFLWLVA